MWCVCVGADTGHTTLQAVVGVYGSECGSTLPCHSLTISLTGHVDMGACMLLHGHAAAPAHAGGYGGQQGWLSVDSKDDCIITLGFNHALCVAWRSDNGGGISALAETSRRGA